MAYFSTALAYAVFISLAALLAPAREGPRRACLAALSAVLLLSLVPKDTELSLRKLFLWEKTEEEYTSGELYYGAWQEGIEEGLKKDLCGTFDLDMADTQIECRLTHKENEVQIASLSITLTGKNIYADVTGLARYVEKNYGCGTAIHLKGD